ncbi:MAG TPA: ATP-binding protein [Candidatus Omnitrophota bacterium]|nr:ATP-binding protein [Candidatus Omnitrophota bacterium]HSA30637.1 ATP-binding protein [Candidatus Omnitrophota bacterium]
MKTIKNFFYVPILMVIAVIVLYARFNVRYFDGIIQEHARKGADAALQLKARMLVQYVNDIKDKINVLSLNESVIKVSRLKEVEPVPTQEDLEEVGRLLKMVKNWVRAVYWLDEDGAVSKEMIHGIIEMRPSQFQSGLQMRILFETHLPFFEVESLPDEQLLFIFLSPILDKGEVIGAIRAEASAQDIVEDISISGGPRMTFLLEKQKLHGLKRMNEVLGFELEAEKLFGHTADGMEFIDTPKGEFLFSWTSVEIDRTSLLLVTAEDFSQVHHKVLQYSRSMFLFSEVLIILLIASAHTFLRLKARTLRAEWEAQNAHILKEANERFKKEAQERMAAQKELDAINKELMLNEQALKKMLSELEQANRSLRDAQKGLLQSEKLAAVGQLAAGVAHEIKNPLAVILLSVETIEEKIAQMDERSVQRLAMIKRSAKRADKVVQELLAFSKSSLETFEAVCLNDVIDGAMTLVKSMDKAVNVTFRSNDGPRMDIMGDRVLLEQAFVNIFLNAVDAFEGGEGEVFIKYSVAGGGDALVEISDTGKGIPEENLAKVFDPFFTTKDPGKGVGLGLSTAHTLITEHKGSISVQSELGKGTTFFVKFRMKSSTQA